MCKYMATEILKHEARQFKIDYFHAKRNQHDREKVLDDFRSGELQCLIATNIAGRGLDIPKIDLVINFDPPVDPEDYVHRIGRTGRAGNKGTAITILSMRDGGPMRYVEQVMRASGI